MTGSLNAEIAAAAARLVVEEGMEYGAAKRRAARTLSAGSRLVGLPGNDQIEDEVRAYIELFHADSQPAELAVLRALAAEWMERLAAFRPYLTGAVWRGTATRLSDIHIELYCDDSKSAELALIDMRVDYDVSGAESPRGRPVDVLSVDVPGGGPGQPVRIAFTVLDYDDLRGALRSDGRGQARRGDLAALEAVRNGP
ncbi:MAG: hypothetical protein ABI699_17575 [Caldimonas sp.]